MTIPPSDSTATSLVDLARTGGQRRVDDRPLLHLGDARRRAHDEPRAAHPALLDLAQEVAQHLLGDLEVGDHAVAQGPDRLDRRRGAADHALRLATHRMNFTGVGVDRDYRRLAGHDAGVADVHQRVGGAQVDRHVAGTHSEGHC
jgi:hypothetical protein